MTAKEMFEALGFVVASSNNKLAKIQYFNPVNAYFILFKCVAGKYRYSTNIRVFTLDIHNAISKQLEELALELEENGGK